jgi:hypothetical protein
MKPITFARKTRSCLMFPSVAARGADFGDVLLVSHTEHRTAGFPLSNPEADHTDRRTGDETRIARMCLGDVHGTRIARIAQMHTRYGSREA